MWNENDRTWYTSHVATREKNSLPLPPPSFDAVDRLTIFISPSRATILDIISPVWISRFSLPDSPPLSLSLSIFLSLFARHPGRTMYTNRHRRVSLPSDVIGCIKMHEKRIDADWRHWQQKRKRELETRSREHGRTRSKDDSSRSFNFRTDETLKATKV